MLTVVWADETSPFTGPQVKALLDENEKLSKKWARRAVKQIAELLEWLQEETAAEQRWPDGCKL